MRVTLYGTRGSIPAPGPETMRYGGNTPAVRVCAENGAVLVLDAGSGIRRLGAQLSATTTRVDILLTHLHMDHIQGLGFFPPLYNPAVEGSPPLGTRQQHSLAGGPLIALSLPASVSNTPSRSAECVVSSRPTPQLRYWPVSYTDSARLSPWADGGLPN